MRRVFRSRCVAIAAVLRLEMSIQSIASFLFAREMHMICKCLINNHLWKILKTRLSPSQANPFPRRYVGMRIAPLAATEYVRPSPQQ